MQKHNMTRELKKLTSAIKVWHLACAGMIAGQAISPAAFAGPKGGTITGGEGGITVEDLATIINQETDLLSIDWESFNISEEELVKFLQPDSSSVVLNRILDSNASEIRGRIESNGHVILANPRGVLFTETATVNVGAITAAGLDMDPADFMNGDFAFKAEGGSAGVVVNRGVINAASAVLVGRQITNAPGSLISAEMVSLAAADEAVLTFDADGLIGVQVTKQVMENDLGIDTAVLNQGQIDGIKVLMEASVSGDLFTSAVNNEGVVRARGIDTSGGTIRLTGSGSSVVNSGVLDVSGNTGGLVVVEGDSAVHSGEIAVRGETGAGGRAHVLGGEVSVSGSIDARGSAGGGEVLVGGGYQGKDSEIRNAKNTTVTAEADIDASGMGQGDGGEVVVWADDSTYFAGSIRAESGELGGDGGLVETSGKGTLSFGHDDMFVSARAHAGGAAGEWLIDPGWFRIEKEGDCPATNCLDTVTITSTLGGGSDLTIKVSEGAHPEIDGSPVEGDNTDLDSILVAASLAWKGDGNDGNGNSAILTLDASGSVQIGEDAGEGVNISGNGADDGLRIIANDFKITDGSSVTVADLDVYLKDSITNNGSIKAGALELFVGSEVEVDGGEVVSVTSLDVSTDNLLGDLSITGEDTISTVTGGLGSDKFTLSNAADTLEINDTNKFILNSQIQFESVEVVDAGSGSDTIIGRDGDDTTAGESWLVGVDGVQADGLTFLSTEEFIANSSSLTASATDKTFQLRKEYDADLDADVPYLSYAGYKFKGLSSASSVSELDVDFVLDASGQDSLVTINSAHELAAEGISFSNIGEAKLVNLAGSTGKNEFTIDSDGVLSDGNIDFTEVENVSADADDTLDSSVALWLSENDENGIGDNKVSTSNIEGTGIAFSGIDDVAVGTLNGASVGTNSFVINSDNKVESNNIIFSGVGFVNGDAGAENTVDTVAGITWELGAANSSVKAVLGENSSLEFTGIDEVTTKDAIVDGTKNTTADSFTYNGGVLGLASYGLEFSDIAEVKASIGDGSTLSSDQAVWNLVDGAGNQVDAGDGVRFNGIDEISTTATGNPSLNGTSEDDEFNILAANRVDVHGIIFNGIKKVDGKGHITAYGDYVVADSLTVDNGNASEPNGKLSGISFSGTESFSAKKIVVEDNIDATWSFNDDGDVNYSSLEVSHLFKGVEAVEAGGGSDIVTGATDESWTITGVNLATNNNVSFQNVEDLEFVGGVDGVSNIMANTGFDDFQVKQEGESVFVEIAGMKIAGANSFESLDAGYGSLSADTVFFEGAIRELKVKPDELTEWTFSGINDVTASTLNADSGSLAFTTGVQDGDLSVSDIDFHGLSLVDVGVSTGNSLIVNSMADTSASVNISSEDNSLSSKGIEFLGIEDVSGFVSEANVQYSYKIEGSVNHAEKLTITGENAVNWNLTDDDSIRFANVDEIDGGVSPNDGVADMIVAIGEVTLTDTAKQINSSGIIFRNIDEVDGGTLLSSGMGDAYVIEGVHQVAANEIKFSDILKVNGNADDTVTGLDGTKWTFDENGDVVGSQISFVDITDFTATNSSFEADAVSLTGDANAVKYNDGILFRGLVSVTTSTLNGTVGSDAFVILDGVSNVEANGIEFSGVTSVVAQEATGDNDTVTSLAGSEWELDTVENNGISFSGIEFVDTKFGTLTGTDSADNFTLNTDGGVIAGDVVYGSLRTVNGGDGDDNLDALLYVAGLEITVNDYEVKANGLDLAFTSIQTADSNVLAGTSGNDLFSLDSSGDLNAKSILADATIRFKGVSTINAGDGNDTLTVAGDSLAFEVAGANILTFDAITANGLDRLEYTDAGTGAGGSATGAAGANWLLEAAAGEVENNGITLAGVSTFAASDGAGLVGRTGSAETFDLRDNGDVQVHGLTFQNLSSVDGGSGEVTDTVALQTSSAATLTGKNGEAKILDILFSDIEEVTNGTIQVSGIADEFIIQDTNKVKANNIAFSDITTISDLGEGDTVIGVAGDGWTLNGTSGQAKSSGITFVGKYSVSAEDSVLTGDAATLETYTLTNDGSTTVQVDDIKFTGLSSVNGGGGDNLNAGAYSDWLVLTGEPQGLKTKDETLAFAGMENVVATSLEGTENADVFNVRVVNGELTTSSYQMNFTGLTEVDAGSGFEWDRVEVTGGTYEWDWWSGTARVFDQIDFSSIEWVTGSDYEVITSDQNDELTVVGEDAVEVNGVRFEGFDFIDAKGGDDTVTGFTGQDWTLLGWETAENNGITFENVEFLIAVEGGGLFGTTQVDLQDGSDNFTLLQNGHIDVLGMDVEGMTRVVAGGGADSLNALAYVDGLSLSDSKAVKAGDLEFTGIDSAQVNALETTADPESLQVTGQGALSIADIDFSGLTSVTDTGGSDTLSSTAAAFGWSLADDSLNVTHAGIIFSGVEFFSGGNGILQGGSASSSYTITDSGALTVDEIRSFSGLGEVQAQGGEDSLATIDKVSLTDSNGAFHTSDIDFTGIVSLNAADLVGTGNADKFQMEGDSKLSIYDLTISGIDTLDAGSDGDTVAGRTAQGYQLNDDGSVTHDGINFTGVQFFEGLKAALVATTGNETFTYSTGVEVESVEVDGRTFTGLTSVNGNGGTDTLAAEGYSGTLVLSGAKNALTNEDEILTFSGMTNVKATDLRGTVGADTFGVSQSGDQVEVSIYDMTFTGLSDVDASDDNDTVNISNGNAQITGEETVSVFDITFFDIEVGTGSGYDVSATNGDDVFNVTESGGVRISGIVFDSFGTINALGGNDTVTGATGKDWTLLGWKEAENNGITFENVEFLIAAEGGLMGTTQVDSQDGSDDFVLLQNGHIDVLGMDVEGMTRVVAGGGTDSLNALVYDGGLSLSGSKAVTAGDLVFSGIDSVQVESLQTSGDVEDFDVTDLGALSVADIDFTDLTSVTDTGGSDTLSSTAAAFGWSLADDSLNVTHAGIIFSGVESFSGGNGILQGGSASSSYTITDSGALTVDEIRSFSGLGEVQAQGGEDSLATIDKVSLTDSNGAFHTSDIDFTGIVSLNAADLVGTGNADKFQMEGDSKLSIYGLTISDIDTLNAGSDGDTVAGRTAQGYQLNDDGSVTHDGINFTGVQFFEGLKAALVATTGNETFTYSTGVEVESVEVDGRTFTGLTSVNGNGGTDTLAAEGYSGTLVLSGAKNALTNEDEILTFSGMTNVKATDLRGTAGADTFDVSQSGDQVEVSIYDMIFTGLGSVDASDDEDTVQVSNGNAQITGDETLSVFDITFSDIEVGTGSGFDVSATDGNDVFSVTESGGVKISGIAFDSFGTIDALGGNDRVTGADGFDWYLKGEHSAENNGITFLNMEELITVNANLLGIDDASVTENFTLISEGVVDVWGMRASGMAQVNARAGTSDLNFGEDYTATLSLNDANNQLEDGDLLFTGIDSASVPTLNTSGGVDAISVTGENKLTAAGIDFRDVSIVADTGSRDTVNSAVTNRDWVLRDNGLDVEHAGITFSAVESFSGGNGILQGGIASSDYAVTASGSVSVDGLRFFSDLAEVQAQAGGDDLAALETVTLTDGSGAFSTSGINFTGVETLTAADLEGTVADDEFTLLADSSLRIYGLTISGIDTLDAAAGSGDRVVGRNGIGYQLSSNGAVTHDGILFSNTEMYEGVGADLTASDADDHFTMTAADAVRLEATGQQFSGLVSANTGVGADTVSALGAVAVTGSKAATAGEIAFSNIETVSGTGALSATGGADSFTIAATGELDSYDIRFEDVTSVAAGGGEDTVQGLGESGWELDESDKALRHAGMAFTGLDVASGGNGVLTGSAAAEQFTVSAANQVTAKGIQFDTVSLVDAAGGANSVVSIDGETWVLGADNRSASASGIQFANVDTISGSALNVDAATNNRSDDFVLEGGALTVRAIEFASVSNVSAGADGGDAVTSSAGEWQLAGGENTEGEVSTGGVSFTGMDRVFTENALLRGSGTAEHYALNGEGALSVSGMAFEGIAEVEAGSGRDSLQGTGGADEFDLAGSGDISVASIRFGGVESVDAGGGGDTVNAEGASWTSVASGDALVEGGAVAAINSLEVLFENLEQVNGAGSYAGLDIDGEYLFDNLNSATIGGVAFADLESIVAGSGNDAFFAADIDANWSLDTGGGLVTSEGASLVFSGFESIFAGSGVDQFILSGGQLATLDTGAGSDSVLLTGTAIASLSLGDGNDLLQVDSDSSQSVALDGGSGEDEFQLRIDDKTWRIFSSDDFSVGSFQFSAFELVENGSDNLNVETDQAFDFFLGDSAGLHFTGSDMRMHYNGSGNVNIVNIGNQTIGGGAQAKRLDLTTAGDVDITTDVEVLNIQGSGDIDIVVVAEQDLVIDEINAGRNGTIAIDSARFGSLTAETYGDTHLTGRTVQLGSELQQWSVIGSAINPLRMDVTESVDIVSITYFQPDFINQVPAFSARGDELQSIAGAQAAQGLKSAVQNAVEDFTQVDPGIFTAVPPYSAGVEVVNAPEMALNADGLHPVYGPAAEEDEDDLEERMREDLPSVDGARVSGGR
ncbi:MULTISPECIES: filamentous hemagglutinin N-terminal domain-containing protein [unclassified Microbulbifer]|uniref:filamentous hemagglutinin N-terminal domain-containing protein n=1 Tax=unclassified Microbulbifer TaxID=2619833 RepID=UPI0027E43360|nr:MULTISPECIES: filamentous hemagglutinin N-terminal domain-containing protein [unclassified Microbulbifer]